MDKYFNEENYITNNFSSENIEKIVARKLTGSILWMIIGFLLKMHSKLIVILPY